MLVAMSLVIRKKRQYIPASHQEEAAADNRQDRLFLLR
jgi:hypothetical protein